LPWRFEPEQNSVEVRIGEVVTVSYRVVNESARETVGAASYNVSPPTVGAYFSKINCFCFTDQRLQAGEKRDLTVVFFVDPALAKDSEEDDLDAITLSYTMYPVRQPEPPRVENGAAPAPGRT
jgi:cytochrome c oxidase assembly protein subunit 11